MDFGIARPNDEAGMTSTGATLGSMNYMSPEQVRCEPVDQRSDLYSMGVSLYEMVTGKLPFRGHSNYSVMSAHLEETPKPPIAVRPDLPKGLSDIILMAMAKDPRERFQTAEAFAAALRSVFPAGAGAVSPIRVPQETPAVSAARIPAQAAAPMAVVAGAESQAAARSGHRGAYMALGGILVVGMLFAAGFYVPRVIKTHAGSRAAAPQSDAQPIAQPAAPPTDATTAATPAPAAGAAEVPSVPAPAATLPASTGLAAPAAAPASAASSVGAHARADSASAKASQQAEQQANQEAEQKANEEAERKAAELKDAEQQFDQLTSRAGAISDGLDTLRRAQATQGYGLRGDISTAEQLMKTDLGRAQDALQQQDGAKAKEYLDKAEVQASIIEKFQGR
jgi:serine/threonine-protein kinase